MGCIMVVSRFLEQMNDAEHQLDLFEKRIVSEDGWIDKTVNMLLDLKAKADDHAANGEVDKVHSIYAELGIWWKLVRLLESGLRSRFPHLCALFDGLVYIYHIASAHSFS